MRGIKIPQYKFALKMQGGLMREGGRICETLWYLEGLVLESQVDPGFFLPHMDLFLTLSAKHHYS